MKKILDKAAARGIDEAEVYFNDSIKEEIKFENDKLKSVSTSQNSGIALRFVKDGRMGHVTSSNLDNIDKLVENALEVSSFSPVKEFDFAKDKGFIAANYGSPKIWDIPMEKLIEDGQKAVDMVKRYDPEVQVMVNFLKGSDYIEVSNSNGVDVGCKKDKFTAGVSRSL
jgi:PmbA protein